MKNVSSILILFLFFSSCIGKRPIPDVSTVLPLKEISYESDGFWSGFAKHMRFKKITPDMEVQLEVLINQGCVPEYNILENKTAHLYSLIPGGGQIYTGEPMKALMYALGSVLVVPYFISFDDAQSSVDYANIEYSIDYCKRKLHLVKKLGEEAKNRQFMNEIMKNQAQKKSKNP